MQARLERLEEQLVIGDERKQRLHDLTHRANIQRVPTVILLESMLGYLEKMAFPDEPSRVPDFVEKELSRPVSQEDLELASEMPEIEPPSDPNYVDEATKRLCSHHAKKIKNFVENPDDFVPIGYQYDGWDAKAFLGRWERVRTAFGWDKEDKDSPNINGNLDTGGQVST